MFERIKFVRYALKFEAAFKSDVWHDVRACFHDDAVYVIEGSASQYDGTHAGSDAIVDVFKRMLDDFDRRFDGAKIRRLSDTMIADECERWAEIARKVAVRSN